jgi:hypothetical protein
MHHQATQGPLEINPGYVTYVPGHEVDGSNPSRSTDCPIHSARIRPSNAPSVGGHDAHHDLHKINEAQLNERETNCRCHYEKHTPVNCSTWHNPDGW